MSLARPSHNNQTRSPQLTATLPPPSPPTTARPQPPRFGAARRDRDPEGPARPLQIHTEPQGRAAGDGRPGRGLAHLPGPHQQHLRPQHGGRGRAAVGAAAVRGSPAGGWRRPLAAASWRSSLCGGRLGPRGAPVPDSRRCEPGDHRFGVPGVGLWCPSLV